MNRRLLLGKGDDINKLASKLSRSDKVNSFDDDDKECGILAHSLSDLEGAFSAFLDIHLPKLMAENIDAEEIEDILFDIGQDFNHILYHIKTPRYFRHMLLNNSGG